MDINCLHNRKHLKFLINNSNGGLNKVIQCAENICTKQLDITLFASVPVWCLMLML